MKKYALVVSYLIVSCCVNSCYSMNQFGQKDEQTTEFISLETKVKIKRARKIVNEIEDMLVYELDLMAQELDFDKDKADGMQ